MMKRMYALSLGLVLVLGLVMFAASSGHAAIQGEIWQNVPASGADASIVPALPPTFTGGYAQFTTNDINYDSRVTGYTPSLFLNSPTFFNATAAFDPNAGFNDTFLRFTGQTYLNAGVNSFVVPHDDGLVLTMGGGIGVVLSQPGPTSPVSSPFDVTAPSAGLYDFTLTYGECCGPPAVLAFEVNGAPVGEPVPEPATMLLVGLGLLGVAGVRRKLGK